MNVFSADAHHDRAIEYFAKYIEMQTLIEAIEAKVTKQCGGNKLLAKQRLPDYYDKASGRKYPSLCTLRDMYMSVAQLSATMAIMLKQG